MVEGGAGLTAFSAVFVPPACCDGSKEEGKNKGRFGGRIEGEKKGRSVVEIETSADQGWGLGCRPNQLSDGNRRSVERLFIVCFGVRKLHSSLLQGACLKGLKVNQMTNSFSMVSSSYSHFFHLLALIHFDFMLAAYFKCASQAVHSVLCETQH